VPLSWGFPADAGEVRASPNAVLIAEGVNTQGAPNGVVASGVLTEEVTESADDVKPVAVPEWFPHPAEAATATKRIQIAIVLSPDRGFVFEICITAPLTLRRTNWLPSAALRTPQRTYVPAS
jgi:hypothetical protein